MKTKSILRGVLESIKRKPKELTEILADAEKPTDYWPDYILWEGKNLFEMYMDAQDEIANLIEIGKSWTEEIESDWEDENDFELEYTFEGQESYLGYSPKGGFFISGWDCWYQSTEDSEPTSVIVYFTFKNGKFRKVRTHLDEEVDGANMYGRRGGYDYLKKKIKDLVDIRLD